MRSYVKGLLPGAEGTEGTEKDITRGQHLVVL